MSGTVFARGENPLRADKLNTAFSERVSRRGDTMQGMLTLWRDPSNPFDAATKQYVDRLTVPPQGAAGPPGPPGPMGPPGSLDGGGGGTLTGPLYYTATGSSAPRSAQDRAAEHYSALDFGVICNGVTDSGAALNAALAAIPPGSTLYVPGSVYTTVTILVRDGRRLEMPPSTLVRPIPNDHATWLPTCAIIGSSTLSPVILVFSGSSPSGGLTNVHIYRNGVPASGTIGLQCIGGEQYHIRVYSWNHAIGIQCGTPQASLIFGVYVCITIAFDHCRVWYCTENYMYLINAPETTLYDMRFGINGGDDTAYASVTSLLTIDGDNNSSAGGTNTVTCLRCQFNVGNDPLYSVRFTKVSFQGPFKFIGCYSGGAKTAFCFIDPDCTFVQGITFLNCTFQPLHVGETFWLDTGHKSNGTKVIGNEFGAGTPASFTMSGIGAVIIGNNWFGASDITIDSMVVGCFIGNVAGTVTFSGEFVNDFAVSGNSIGTLHYIAATGPIAFNQAEVLRAGGAISLISPVDNSYTRLIEPSNVTPNFVHLMPGSTGSIWDTPFSIGTDGGVTAVPGGQAAATQIVPQHIASIAANGNTGNGVKLPPATPGYWQVVTNVTSLSATVYGTDPDTINGIATATGLPLASGKTLLVFCYHTGVWWGGLLS